MITLIQVDLLIKLKGADTTWLTHNPRPRRPFA